MGDGIAMRMPVRVVLPAADHRILRRDELDRLFDAAVGRSVVRGKQDIGGEPAPEILDDVLPADLGLAVSGTQEADLGGDDLHHE
jgi:hypothetical protein